MVRLMRNCCTSSFPTVPSVYCSCKASEKAGLRLEEACCKNLLVAIERVDVNRSLAAQKMQMSIGIARVEQLLSYTHFRMLCDCGTQFKSHVTTMTVSYFRTVHLRKSNPRIFTAAHECKKIRGFISARETLSLDVRLLRPA